MSGAAAFDWFHRNSSLFALMNTSDNDIMKLLNGDIQKKRLVDQPPKLIALIVSVISLLVNICSLLAITKVKGLLTTNLRLIISLCISDMLVSTCVLLGNFDLTPLSNNNYETCLFVSRRSLRMTSHLISLLNLLGLAFDHYFAIVRPLNYFSTMCPRRTNLMICLFWLLAGVIGFSDFFIPFFHFGYCDSFNETMTYCESVWCTAYDSEYLVIIMAFILLISMSCIYIRIYIQIRKYTNFEGRHQRFVRRTRRGLCTTLIIVGTFMICWLPYCIFEVTITIQMLSNIPSTMQYYALIIKLDFYLYDLLLMNCLIDPIIYALRMREVRRGYSRWMQMCSQQKPKLRLSVRFTHEPNTHSCNSDKRVKNAVDNKSSSPPIIRGRLYVTDSGMSNSRCIRFSSKHLRSGADTSL